MTTADAVGFLHEGDGVAEGLAVQGDGNAFLEFDLDDFGLDFNGIEPVGDAHDRFDDLHARGELFEVLRFVRGAQHVGVGRIGLFRLHAVFEAFGLQEGRHFGAAAEFGDELHVEPGLVDAKVRVRQEAVAVEAFDVVALVGRAVAPDVDAVFAHGCDEHRARHGAAERRRVEVERTRGRNVEGARLNGGEAFMDELRAAVDEAGLDGAVFHRAARNGLVVRFVGLAEVGRVGIGERALVLHPAKRSARIQTAGEGDADLFANRNTLQNRLRHR